MKITINFGYKNDKLDDQHGINCGTFQYEICISEVLDSYSL